MHPKTGNHRVLLVFLLFLPISLLALWYVGGNRQEFELTVTSDQSPAAMEQRFNQIVASLDSLTPEQLVERVESRQDRESPTKPLRLRHVHYQAPTASLVTPVPVALDAVAPLRSLLADIVIPQMSEEDQALEIDPSIVYRDAEFENTSVNRAWLGKDLTSVYLQETDFEEHLRFVRLDRSQLKFEPVMKDGKTGCRIVYSFSVHHEGLRRLYGKFLERECELLAQNRLQWICQQLEGDSMENVE